VCGWTGAHPLPTLLLFYWHGDLRDVLALESEVARAIAKQIQAELTPEETARLSTPPQVDPGDARWWFSS
jgi:hypothetical protein